MNKERNKLLSEAMESNCFVVLLVDLKNDTCRKIAGSQSADAETADYSKTYREIIKKHIAEEDWQQAMDFFNPQNTARRTEHSEGSQIECFTCPDEAGQRKKVLIQSGSLKGAEKTVVFTCREIPGKRTDAAKSLSERDIREILSSFNQAVVLNGISVWLLNIEDRSAERISSAGHNNLFGTDSARITNAAITQVERNLIHRDDIETYLEMYDRICSGDESVTGEIRHWSDKYGDYTWFEYNFILTEKKNGKPLEALITVRDILAEKTMESIYLEEVARSHIKDDTILSACRLNISTNELEAINIQTRAYNYSESAPVDFRERLGMFFDEIWVSDEELNTLNAESLREAYSRGEHKVRKNFWVRERVTRRTLWIQTDCKIIEKNNTGELIAFFYNHDYTDSKLEEGMMINLVHNNYERCAAIFVRENRIRPLLQLAAGYGDCWRDDNYEEGIANYSRKAVAPADREKVEKMFRTDIIKRELENCEEFSVRYDIVNENGKLRQKKSSFSWIDREREILLMSRSDVGLYEHLRYLYEYDALTGVYNRKKFFDEVERMLREHPEHTYALYYIDIDRFNLYNSAFGEEAGNQLLKVEAEIVSKCAKFIEHSVYGRLNGDVFCILAPVNDRLRDIGLKYAGDVLKKFRPDYALKFSVGQYTIKDPSMQMQDMLAHAKEASKICKLQYNKNLQIFNDYSEEKWRQSLEISGEMQSALREGQFKVYIQAKYNLATNTYNGAEALVRWIHPQKGAISPGIFIPVFEKNGFIAELDQEVWRQVCILLKKWLDEGLSPEPISVNVSRISLYNPQLDEILCSLLETYNIPVELLQLEITESAYMTNPDLMKRTIEKLHRAGFVILMDDFGSGYSSLNTLKDFYIDVLKVDMKFLPQKENAEQSKIILASIIHMAKWLGIEVVMEGVETKYQKDFLKSVNCDYIQGYYYAKPMPSESYADSYVRAQKSFEAAGNQEAPEVLDQILLIGCDDECSVQVPQVLEKDYNLKIFRTFEEGVTYLQQNFHAVNLILTDNDAFSSSKNPVVNYCESVSYLQMIPKIVIGGNSAEESIIAATLEGADGYLTKPLNEKLLGVLAKNWTRKSKRIARQNMMHDYAVSKNERKDA